MAGGLYIIIAISVCALLIAANLFVRRNRRTTDDWHHQCTDADCHLIKILNSVHHGKVD